MVDYVWDQRLQGANIPDAKLLAETLDAVVVTRCEPTEDSPQLLCLDKGFDNLTGRQAAAEHKYQPHIRWIGEEKLYDQREKRHPARRWVVKRTLARLSKCRALLARYDKHAASFLDLLKVTCVLVWYRRLHRLSPLR